MRPDLKNSSSSVLDVITERLVIDDVPKEDLPLIEEYIIKDKQGKKQQKDKQVTTNQLPSDWIIVKDHLRDQILGNITKGVSTRLQINNFCKYSAFIFQTEPKVIFYALLEEG